jgi:hypothetical protein
MKNYTLSSKFKKAMSRLFFSLLFAVVSQTIFAQYGNIDIGIFEATSPANTIQVKLRPDFQIDPIETISGILYTVRWEDPTISITMNYISPYFVAPQGSPVLYNGHYYQIFAAVPFSPVGTTINPGDELLISSFSFTGGACSYFEIIENDWTIAHNGGVYLEFLGTEVTGIIYKPIVQLGSVGGNVSGGGTIAIGESTGTLTLTDYTGVILKWQKRLNSGSWADIPGTSGLPNYSEIPTSAGVWEYRAAIQKGTCPVAYATPALVTVIGVTQWTGNIDDDWFKTGNWTYGVPHLEKDAIIPDVDPNPYPIIVGDANCKNADIMAGASVTIATDGTLKSYGTFKNDGSFTIKSSPTDDGSFIDNGTITGTGTNTVERYIEKLKWHYVSTPIADGVSNIYYHIYLKSFSEQTGTWTYIAPVNIPMIPMKGYAAWASTELTGSKTVFYTGTLNTGSYTTTLTHHESATHGYRGYNFIGNPYPSAIDWDQSLGWTKTNVDNAVYFWNPLIGQYGSYVTYPPAGTNGATSIIPSGQGFFVHVTNGNATGSISVNNNARLHHDKQFLKGAMADPDYAYLQLKTTSEMNTYSDETVIRFLDEATPSFDSESDALKMYGLDEAPQLYSVTPDHSNLAVNTNPELIKNTIIPLGFRVGISGIYKIETAVLINFSSDTEIKLEDKKENIFIDLNEQANYSFPANPLDDPDRFNIHFIPNPSISSFGNMPQNIFIFTDGNDVFIRHSEGESLSGDVEIHDLLGRLIYFRNIAVHESYQISGINKGMYLISFQDRIENKAYRKKVLLK